MPSIWDRNGNYQTFNEDGSTPTRSSSRAINFEQIEVSTLKTLTPEIYTLATQALIIVETASIRYRIDGGTPTATVGMLANIGDKVTISSSSDIANFKAIATSSGSLIDVTYSL